MALQADYQIAVETLVEGLRQLQALNHDERSREMSLAITNIEQGIMWANKDRTIRGLLQPYPTHVEEQKEEVPCCDCEDQNCCADCDCEENVEDEEYFSINGQEVSKEEFEQAMSNMDELLAKIFTGK